MQRITITAFLSALLASMAAHAGEKTRVLAGWGSVTDPSGACQFKVSPVRLVISVPQGNRDLDPRGEFNVNGPRVLQEVSGDFSVEVRVTGTILPEKNMELAGKPVAFRAGALLVWQDAKNFLRLDYGGMIKEGKDITFAYFHAYKDGKLSVSQGPPLGAEPILFRIERKGDRFTASAHQGKADKSLPKVTWKAPATLGVGVGAVNVSRQDLHAVFEDLKITARK